jgi:V/A-type H+-transporting ATPase subunit E
MGCEELIESLRKEAEEKVREIRRETEEEAGKIKAGFSLKLEVLRRENAAGGSSGVEGQKVLLDAGNRARTIRLTAEGRLSARLYILAVSSLHILRVKGYEDIFHRLAMEIPPLLWRSVQVNQEDCDLARKFFPDAEIVAARNITGGMEVETERGLMSVANTFEKRLERAWPQMLPELIGDINREVMNNDESPRVG